VPNHHPDELKKTRNETNHSESQTDDLSMENGTTSPQATTRRNDRTDNDTIIQSFRLRTRRTVSTGEASNSTTIGVGLPGTEDLGEVVRGVRTAFCHFFVFKNPREHREGYPGVPKEVRGREIYEARHTSGASTENRKRVRKRVNIGWTRRVAVRLFSRDNKHFTNAAFPRLEGPHLLIGLSMDIINELAT
jgi:hypothetical protein